MISGAENMKKPASIRNICSAAHGSRQNLSSLKDGFISRLMYFRRNRTTAEPEEMEKDFGLVLTSWGIDDEDDIPCVTAILRIRLYLFAVCALVCLVIACLQASVIGWIVLALVAAPCVLGTLTALWRISILRRKKFTPFFRWLSRPRGQE